MLSQLLGAVLRAVVVFFVVATPALLLEPHAQAVSEAVVLACLMAALLIFSEYVARAPALIEFRSAPPFNRIRIAALWAMLALASILQYPQLGAFSGSLDQFGRDLAQMTHLPISSAQVLACLAGLSGLVLFGLIMRLSDWPQRGTRFNLWVNLPNFDPTTGGDVIGQLRRDARINALLALALPFFLPMGLRLGADYLDITLVDHGHGWSWMVALWAFLPMSLLMRAMALSRLASLIAAKRKRLIAELSPEERLALG